MVKPEEPWRKFHLANTRKYHWRALRDPVNLQQNRRDIPKLAEHLRLIEEKVAKLHNDNILRLFKEQVSANNIFEFLSGSDEMKLVPEAHDFMEQAQD